VNLDFEVTNLFSNENANILWAISAQNEKDEILEILEIPLNNFDASTEERRSIKLENRKSDFVLLPENKLGYIDQLNKLNVASMLTGEILEMPITLTDDCTIVGNGSRLYSVLY